MSYKTEQIIKNNLITNYLASKNIHPSSSSGDKLVYKCPLPSHPNDNTPSFYVYDKEGRQDFFCWGCKRSGIIINLIHHMEDEDTESVFERLSHGIDFSVDNEINSHIKGIIKDVPETTDNETWLLAMKMAIWTQNQLEQLEFDQEFFAKCEKMYYRLDQHLAVDDLSFIREVDERLPSQLNSLSAQILKKRADEEKKDFRNKYT